MNKHFFVLNYLSVRKYLYFYIYSFISLPRLIVFLIFYYYFYYYQSRNMRGLFNLLKFYYN